MDMTASFPSEIGKENDMAETKQLRLSVTGMT